MNANYELYDNESPSNDESSDSVVTLGEEETSVIEYFDPDEQEGI